MPFDGTIRCGADTILRQLRDAIGQPGAWCKHGKDGPDGSHCILGWAYEHGGEIRDQWDALDLLRKQAWAEGWVNAIEFNDSPKTTQADVVAFIDRAISSGAAR